jgi:hypothetical protein
VNTKLLDYVPENKIKVRMSLMPEKMRAILENSPIIKRVLASSWRSFSKQDTQSRTSNFSPIIYPTKKQAGTGIFFNIINNQRGV